MASFKKPGDHLRRARYKTKVSRKDIADRLTVSVNDIKMLEQWQLEKLSDSDQAPQLIRRYALLVGLNPADFSEHIPIESRSLIPPKERNMIILSKMSLWGIGLIVALISGGFLAWRTFIATSSPELYISEPAQGAIITTPTATIKGQTSDQAQVHVESANVPVAPDGSFTADVVLEPGPNVVNITAVNTFGQKSESTLNLKYEVVD